MKSIKLKNTKLETKIKKENTILLSNIIININSLIKEEKIKNEHSNNIKSYKQKNKVYFFSENY